MPKLENMLTQEEIEQIVNWYSNENVSLREIERRTHHGRNAVSGMLERLGVKTTSGNHYRKYFFNFDFFEKIDNEFSAYWLGFLYADGSIESKSATRYGEQSFKIAIAEQDLELLEKFKEDIQSTYPIRYDDSRVGKGNSQSQVIQSLRSQKTVDDLIRLGCIEKKSLILTFPSEEQVPQEYLRHFIRGYFDGDGSISIYNGQANINFVGTENFINGLHNVVQMGSVYPDKRKQNSWYLGINGNLQILKMYHYMYDDATRYMARKYKKFQPLIEKYGESRGTEE